jgi:chromosomal replication initiator protein
LAPNEYVADHISRSYLERIRDIFEHLGEARDTVTVEVGVTPVTAPSTIADDYRDTPVLSTGLDRRYLFNNFVSGKSNELAYAAAQQVAKKPGGAYNPLLLYGGTGLGKTHLLHASGNFIREQNPSARVLYLHSESFVSEMIAALRRDKMESFKTKYRTAEALLPHSSPVLCLEV